MGRLLCASAVAAAPSSATTHAVRRVRSETMRGSSGGCVFCSGALAFAMADESEFFSPDTTMSTDRTPLSDTLGRRSSGRSRSAIVGVAEHGNSAVLVTVTAKGQLRARRTRARVRRTPRAREPGDAVRRCAGVDRDDRGPGVSGASAYHRGADRRQSRANDRRLGDVSRGSRDSSRKARWSVHWYDRERVFRDSATAIGHEDIHTVLREMGRAVGPP